MIHPSAIQQLLEPINHFLQCPTPDEWVEEARKPENLRVLLLDHLLCELKAGQSAMFLIRKYAVDKESELRYWIGLNLMKTLRIAKLEISNRSKAKAKSPKRSLPNRILLIAKI